MSTDIKRQLVVFDFDWSFVDQDTDRWIFEVLAPHLRRKMKTLKDQVQWTDLVAQTLVELHALGKTREDIEHALRILPVHPAMIRAVKALKERTSKETQFVILSNSNSVFISTILEDRQITSLFTEVTTNPAEWDSSGLLKLKRRVDPSGPQHNCGVGCSPNMCKGEELENFISRQGQGFDRIIYVGDGANDYCPVRSLQRQDLALVRKFRGLERRIAREGGVKCEVKYWAGAWEVEEIFADL